MITGSLLKKMREETGVTQERLAELVGISQAHVAKIENEKVNPTLSTVNKIISVLETRNTLKCDEFVTKKIICVKPEDLVNHTARLMKENNISQIPVISKGISVGSMSDKTIVRNLDKITNSTRVKDLMDEPFPTINCGENLEVVKTLLEYHQAVLIVDKGEIIGILTKSDLLDLLK